MRGPLHALLGTVFIAAALAACGSQKFTTLNAQQAKAEQQQCEKLPTLTQVVNPCPNQTNTVVADCGGGLSTAGACRFARDVKRAYLAAKQRYGRPPSGLTVDTNPVSCAASASVWRCTSHINPAVWVQQRG